MNRGRHHPLPLVKWVGMKFCIDTNVFFTFQKGVDIGKNPGEVMESLASAARAKRVECVIPQKIASEIADMLAGAHEKEWRELLGLVAIKTPKIHTHSIASSILYEFVNDYRKRAHDGLKVSEDILIQVARNPVSTANRVEFEKSLRPHKESLRTRYRNATRTGTIDSVADLDIILLSLEESATLVSADEGVVVWGRKFGVKEMDLPIFGQKIREAAMS